MIIGTGIDIVETERVRALIDRDGERFLGRWFGAEEIAYCGGKAKPYLHFASRLAAKEAAFKALRLSKGAPICWKHIVVVQDEAGAPRLALSGEPRAAAERLGATGLHVSLSHCGAYAIAAVTAEGSDR
ncbi:MAG TPA: holo-ACP synthase [Spirochaetales bacterium]|nr:holo-ACP synthase [Spirochaetales bacterium]HRZ64885.1 holo-ACP synthase [Spirochaetia bacterium]